MTSRYEVRLAPDAERTYRRLPDSTRKRVREAVLRPAERLSEPGRRMGKSVRTIRGTADSFHRLRVGDLRVMCDVIPEDTVILVLGIVDRRDLERWLRSR
ncbi:MAG: type II toxin-antitoxin system RelE/ParE family toxin [Actinobacteria bacterium]|nr:type II toxin-antitoxin system RelE/ParE family toxin [Actinomycetota bacterium]